MLIVTAISAGILCSNNLQLHAFLDINGFLAAGLFLRNDYFWTYTSLNRYFNIPKDFIAGWILRSILCSTFA